MNMSKPIFIPAGKVSFVPSDYNTAVIIEERQFVSPSEKARREEEVRERERSEMLARQERKKQLEQQRMADAHRQGYEKASREYQEKLNALQADQKMRCTDCGHKFDAFLVGMKHEIGAQLVDMSIRVAETILRHELPDPRMLADIISETLDPISDLQGAKMRMNPADIAMMKDKREDNPVPLIITDRVELIPDDMLSSGDMVLESCNGFFDSRIQQRIELLEKSMKERYRNAENTVTNT